MLTKFSDNNQLQGTHSANTDNPILAQYCQQLHGLQAEFTGLMNAPATRSTGSSAVALQPMGAAGAQRPTARSSSARTPRAAQPEKVEWLQDIVSEIQGRLNHERQHVQLGGLGTGTAAAGSAPGSKTGASSQPGASSPDRHARAGAGLGWPGSIIAAPASATNYAQCESQLSQLQAKLARIQRGVKAQQTPAKLNIASQPSSAREAKDLVAQQDGPRNASASVSSLAPSAVATTQRSLAELAKMKQQLAANMKLAATAPLSQGGGSNANIGKSLMAEHDHRMSSLEHQMQQLHAVMERPPGSSWASNAQAVTEAGRLGTSMLATAANIRSALQASTTVPNAAGPSNGAASSSVEAPAGSYSLPSRVWPHPGAAAPGATPAYAVASTIPPTQQASLQQQPPLQSGQQQQPSLHQASPSLHQPHQHHPHGYRDKDKERRLVRENAELKQQVEQARKDYDQLHHEFMALYQKQDPGRSIPAQPLAIAPAACPKCADAAVKVHDLQVQAGGYISDLGEVRASLQEAREREAKLQAQLAQAQEANAALHRESSEALVRMEKDLRGLYALATHRASSEEPDMGAVAAAVERRLRHLTSQAETAEVDVHDLRVEISRLKQEVARKDFDHGAQLAEAEAARDKAIADLRAAQEQAAAASAREREAHGREVSSLTAGLRAVQEQLEAVQQASSSEIDQLRHYASDLERRQVELAAKAREGEEAAEEVAGLRKQIALVSRKLRESHDHQDAVESMEREMAELQAEVQARDLALEALQAELQTYRAKLSQLEALAHDRGEQLEAVRKDLGDAARRLQQAAEREPQLKKQLASVQRELREEQAARQAADAAAAAAVAQARAAQAALPTAISAGSSSAAGASPLAPVSMFNDGTELGLAHENRVLRERLSEIEAEWREREGAAMEQEQAWSTDRMALEQEVVSLQRQLAAAQHHVNSQSQSMQKLAEDCTALQRQLEDVKQQAADARARSETNAAAELDAQLLRGQVDALKESEARLKEQLGAVEKDLGSRLTPGEGESLRARLKDYEEKLSIRSTEVADMRTSMVEYEAAISGLEEELGAAQARAQAAEEGRAAAMAELSAVAAANAELQSTMDALGGPAGAATRVRQLEAQLQDAQQQVSTLAYQLSEAAQQRDLLTHALREKEEELMHADGKVQVLRNELIRLQNYDGSGNGF